MDSGSTPRRTHLPAKMVKSDLGIWSVLKSCVGKDLSKITMPVQFNEPLSFLQRISESLEYSSLLDKLEKKNEIERMEIVAAFAVSNLASNYNRLGKPFNPLIGETYELEINGFRFLCEQVSHHPPISAFHADSETFVFQGWIYPKLKLGAKSIEVHPKGRMQLYLKRFNETYSWGNVNCSVHNVIVGKLWIEHHGQMEVSCPETGLSVNLHFKAAGWFHNELHRVDGFIVDSNRKKLRYVYGKWTEGLWSTDFESFEEYEKSNDPKIRLLGECSTDTSIKKSPSVSPKPGKKIFQKLNSLSLRSFSTNYESSGVSGELSPESQEDSLPKSNDEIIEIPNSKVLWEVSPRPEYSHEYYHFTLFTMSLNQLVPPTSVSICPTDSRLRPDIRKLEEADLEGASFEKLRLEEQQRKLFKAKPDILPLWFEKNGIDWKFTGEYWKSPKSNIARIF